MSARESANKLVKEYAIEDGTITELKRKEDKFHEFAASIECQSYTSKRKIMCLAKNKELEEVVYLWFIQKKAKA